MRIYLASAYSRRLLLAGFAEELHALGHEVTASWLWEEHMSVTDDGVTLTGPPESLAALAERDLRDIEGSDLFICFAEPLGAWSRGSRHAELGAALVMRKRVWLVGEREHLFHYHPSVTVFAKWRRLTVALAGEAP